MSSLNRLNIAEGVYFNSVRDSRFKTMKLSANLFVPLSAETASENALLAGVLSRSCKAYPDFTALSRKLSALYGAELSVSTSKVGENQVISISASGLDDRYALDGDSVAGELSALLCGVVFEPNVKDDAFVSGEVEQERRQLLDVIDSEYNEKRIYANARMIEIMCADEVFGVKRYGTAEKIKEATAQSLYCTWQNLLKTAVIEIMYIGDSAPDKAVAVFTETFGKMNRQPAKLHTEVVRTAGDDLVVLDLHLDTAAHAADGTLCFLPFAYYCAARYDKHKGVVIIDSGVENENIEKLERGILKEIEDMKNGVITDFEIDSTKMAMINIYQSSNDTVSGIEAWYSSQLLQDSFKSIDEACAKINAVTKEEIIAAANKLQLDTVYVLTNQQEVKS